VIETIVPLCTDRLELEPLRVDHAEEMARVLGDPALHARTGGSPPDLDQLRERYRLQSAGRSPDGSQLWMNWVVRRRDDRAALGYVQATVELAPDGAAEVAWVVGSPHQGRGYAREAARAMVTWLQDEGVRVVVAHIAPGHAASEAVARAAGLAPTTTVVDGETRWSSEHAS
jgi:RimJ/RimL family protein N-acetyltransferase